MDTQLLLLRGINVGGRNRVPMADLRALLASLGCEDVSTYVQSGNVVCRAAGPPEVLAGRLGAAITAELGLTVPVVGRTAAEWAATVAANPLCDLDDDPTRLHVTFLAGLPDPERVDALVAEAGALAPEVVAVSGRDVYLHLPSGYHRAKLNQAFLERRLGQVATARNWRTVLALADLAGVGT
jgi:uncharacterized protein (DUF1697 family)